MNKTDKFLYGGFAVVAIAVIVAMLVTVFSPPKQIAEEPIETPQIERPTLAPVVEVESILTEEDSPTTWMTMETKSTSPGNNSRLAWLTKKN